MRPLLVAGCVLSLSWPLSAFAAEPEEAPEPLEPPTLEAQGNVYGAPDGAVYLSRKALKASASSSLCEGKKKALCHGVELLVDGDNATAWCEGAKGEGEDESITLTWSEPREVVALDFVPYYAKDMRRASTNGRPSLVRIEVGEHVFHGGFEDHVARVRQENTPKGRNEGGCGDETCASKDERIQSAEEFRISLPQPVKATKVRVVLVSSFPAKFPDTCMSELSVAVKKSP